MTLSLTNHSLDNVTQVSSPNCNDRPDCARVDLLVIHGISLPPGQYGGPYITQLFTNCLDPGGHDYFAEISHLEVSSHAVICRKGEIVQYVPFNMRAWHAGDSCFNDEINCNDFSIGIELEGSDEEDYEPEQYTTLITLTQLLMKMYPGITKNRIVRHSDISPGRKTDPGPGFDWQGFLSRISEE